MQEILSLHFYGLRASLEDSEENVIELEEALEEIGNTDGISSDLSDEIEKEITALIDRLEGIAQSLWNLPIGLRDRNAFRGLKNSGPGSSP